MGIKLMQDYDIVVDPDSLNLIKELNNYRSVTYRVRYSKKYE